MKEKTKFSTICGALEKVDCEKISVATKNRPELDKIIGECTIEQNYL